MDYDYKGVKELVPGASDIETIDKLREVTEEQTGRGYIPKADGQIDVGIVGAGVAGLFTALLLTGSTTIPISTAKVLRSIMMFLKLLDHRDLVDVFTLITSLKRSMIHMTSVLCAFPTIRL